jgi:DNA-binding NarL/FixJ family response regulator
LKSKVGVLVVDGHPFFRSGISQWLNRQAEFYCCGEAESLQSGRRAVHELKPEIVLIELQLGDGNGLDLVAEMTRQFPDTKFIALSHRDESMFAERALQAGARGYVMKSEAVHTVLLAMQTARRGELFVSRSMGARLLHNLNPKRGGPQDRLSMLSDRELQVFQLLGSGSTTREIAEALSISPKTVETYREHLKAKLLVADGEALRTSAELWVREGVFKAP